MSWVGEFRAFVVRGSVVDMAVGIAVGGAFATLASSFVSDLLMPPLGLVLGGADFSNLFLTLSEGSPAGPYDTLAAAKEAGAVTLNVGAFLNTVVALLVVAAALFLVIKTVNAMHDKPTPKTPQCPFCKSAVHKEATRCAHCTSELPSPASP